MKDLKDRLIAQLENELRQEKYKYQCLLESQHTLEQEKAEDARREMLVGAALMVSVDEGDLPRDRLMAILDKRLMRNEDRALFHLPPIHMPDKHGQNSSDNDGKY